MYTRIGILGRARQAIGIARLHAPREALYIDVKYNSLTHSLRTGGKIIKTRLTGRASLATFGSSSVLRYLRGAERAVADDCGCRHCYLQMDLSEAIFVRNLGPQLSTVLQLSVLDAGALVHNAWLRKSQHATERYFLPRATYSARPVRPVLTILQFERRNYRDAHSPHQVDPLCLQS